jgi:hypothetical protein
MPVETSKDAEAFHQKLDEAFPDVTKLARKVADEIGADYDELKRQFDVQRITAPAPSSPYPASLDEAVAMLQANIPSVRKGEVAEVKGETKDGRSFTYTYAYADLSDITDRILPLLGALGLSWRCRPTLARLEGETGYRFVLHYKLSHVSGTFEEGYWPLPDRADPQAVGSAITYARRYALCAATGVAPGGDDEDGAAAKQASRPTESLAQASKAGLTDTDRRAIEAALTPAGPGQAALWVPVGKLPELWQRVVKAGAENGESPIRAPEPASQLTALTWKEAFGLHFANRIDAIQTPDDWKTMQAEIIAAGGKATLFWGWQGVSPADRFKARGKAIGDLQAATTKELEERIAAATTREELDRASILIGEAHEAYKIHAPHPNQLQAFVEERWVKLDMADASEIQGEAADAAIPDPTESDYSPGYYTLRLSIWSGEPLGVTSGDVDGAYERGAISIDEKVALHHLLSERPEPAVQGEGGMGLVNWLDWQIETCLDSTELDAVRDVAVNSRPAGLIDESWARRLYAHVEGRRLALQGKTSDY